MPWLAHWKLVLTHRPEERTHLGIHLDSSFFTFNILLSDPEDFDGGDFYLFSPQQTQEHLASHDNMTTAQKQEWVMGHSELPVVAGYGCGDTLAFSGDHHLHGTLPVKGGA